MGILNNIKENIGSVVVLGLLVMATGGSVGYIIQDVRDNTADIRANTQAIQSLRSRAVTRGALDSLETNLMASDEKTRRYIFCVINAERRGELCEE